jgi:predicted HTH domain antitoxin
METVKVDLPAALLQAAKLDAANLSEEAARLLALELFREEKVSLGRAAELCRTPLAAFMAFAAAHEVSPIRYGVAELEQDRSTLAELGL